MLINYRLEKEHETIFLEQIRILNDTSRFRESRQYMQHGTTSVYVHSISVAWVSCLLAEQLHLQVDWLSMIRGALLHDYFLYDWHEKDAGHRLHGFHHPARALKNARADFSLNDTESFIILRHMFPLTPVPPASAEGWIVCLADKICSSFETFHQPLVGSGYLSVMS
ncbi:MAG: phosphohydrolase [Lachnospiraceae bacterium]|nr:phosphohydrolase [Lachnospiraceae bacterium]